MASIDRLLWQYRDSPNVKALIQSYLAEFPEMEQALAELLTRLDIGASIGQQLDGIGEILGQPRPGSIFASDDDLFSFAGPSAGEGFGSVAFPSAGGRFTGLDGIIVGNMPDAEYRVLLRATVFRNIGLSDIDHILAYSEAVIGTGVQAHEGVGYVTLTVPRQISPVEVDLIRRTIPLAAGVRLAYIAFSQTPVTGSGGFDNIAGNGATAGAFVGLA